MPVPVDHYMYNTTSPNSTWIQGGIRLGMHVLTYFFNPTFYTFNDPKDMNRLRKRSTSADTAESL